MPNHRTLLVVAAVLTALVQVPPALAGQLAEENFSISFPVYASGGTGFSGSWTVGGFNAFAAGYTQRVRSLCHPRLDTAGGSVSGDAFQAINGAVRTLAQPLGAPNTTAYVSFLIQPRGTLNDGIFNGFFGLTLNGSAGNDLFIGKPGGGTLDQYVLENRGGAGQIPSGLKVKIGKTVLLVLKAQFMAGNDVFTLYTNPSVGKPEPASPVVKTDVDLGTVSKIGIYSTGAFIIDEIRIGTTFADVLPISSHHHDDDDDFPGCSGDHDH
jgi:hypothetical protein